jgi:hypothetical protein
MKRFKEYGLGNGCAYAVLLMASIAAGLGIMVIINQITKIFK